MWKPIAAGAAALLIAGSSVVYAQNQNRPGREGLRDWRPSVEDMRAFGEARLGRHGHRAVRVETAGERRIVAEIELRRVRGDGRVLCVRDVGDVDDGIRAERLAHLVERDAGQGEIGEERLVALHDRAEGIGQRDSSVFSARR